MKYSIVFKLARGSTESESSSCQQLVNSYFVQVNKHKLSGKYQCINNKGYDDID